MEWSWFRTPRGDDPGTTNLCYNAVDRHVIRGAAAAPALTGADPFAFDRLLEEVAALAGAFRGLGVDDTTSVAVVLDEPRAELLALLAGSRLGAPVALPVDAVPRDSPPGAVAALVDRERPRLLVTDRRVEYGGHVPAACLLRGAEPEDDARELAWDVALRAGRTDPAGCVAVPPHATAYVVGEPVALVDVPADHSRIGGALRALLAAEPVDA